MNNESDIVDFDDNLNLDDEGITTKDFDTNNAVSSKPMAEKNRQFLGMFSQNPIIRTFSGFSLPIFVAIIVTAILSVPNMKRIPIIGYFRKTLGFISITLWLVCVIFTIISLTMDGQFFSLTRNQQWLTLILIGIGGVVYNMLFNMEKPPASANQMLLQAQSAYSNTWNGYLQGADFSITKETEIFNNLAGRIASIVQGVDEISISDQAAIVAPLQLDIIDESTKTFTPAIRIEKCMDIIYQKQNTYQVGGLAIKPNQGTQMPSNSKKAAATAAGTTIETMRNVLAADPAIAAGTVTPAKTAAIDDLNAYYASIGEFMTQAAAFEAVGDFARAETMFTEAYNKSDLVICGKAGVLVHDWNTPDFSANPAAPGFWAPADLIAYKGTVSCGVQSFTQPGDLWPESRNSIQDLIDTGTIG